MIIQIGEGSCGIAAGATKIRDALSSVIKEDNLQGIELTTTGCVGTCYLEPMINICGDDGSVKTYVKLTPESAREILHNLENDEIINKYEISENDRETLNSQKRIALRNCGVINPEKLEDYQARGGYEALKKALDSTPGAVIDEIKVSGLAGRGGAGFPTWFKWNVLKNQPGDKKYMICNADEGDPGAFMDRSVLEGDPHGLIEGMLIGAYATGANEGIVYVRAEYPLAIIRLQNAIEQANAAGFLGDNILGTSFSFSMRIKAGAGAFVCGEETALIASLEGERGMPRLKPPFPAEKGYWQRPSNINNVETYANIAWIIANGGKAFSAMGTENSKGTKVFALTGKIKSGGLVEVPMGMTVREVIFGLGGGIKNGKRFKAVQMGGPSGGCVPEELLDTKIDYRELSATGAIMGSGGMVVMDETTCMVDMARYFLDFTCNESCGKCIHCRIGTKRMLEILTRITQGDGQEGDIELLESLGNEIKNGSLCGLGQTAPNPVLTTIRYFKNEYEDHIKNKKCTAKQCKPLIAFSITEACTGCGLCAKKCPVGAISGERRSRHVIDGGICTKCGKCNEVCHFGAVEIQ